MVQGMELQNGLQKGSPSHEGGPISRISVGGEPLLSLVTPWLTVTTQKMIRPISLQTAIMSQMNTMMSCYMILHITLSRKMIASFAMVNLTLIKKDVSHAILDSTMIWPMKRSVGSATAEE
jgi:hypothetical protein